jgi:hypothetical protein
MLISSESKSKKDKNENEQKEKNELKQELIKDLLKINEQHKKEGLSGAITRDYYRTKSIRKENEWTSLFGTFSNFKKAAFSSLKNYNAQQPESIIYTERINIDIVKNDETKIEPRRYFVTSAIAGAKLNQSFFNSILTYCKNNKAELVILPMKGINVEDEYYPEELLEYSDHFATEFRFNSNLVAKDFMISPQQINPLEGLQRFGQRQYSLIIASPKQFMCIAPVSSESLPHIIHSTGCVSSPKYATTRIGRLADQDHCCGGLIVEIRDNKMFHIRQAVSDDQGGFFDLGKYYIKDKIVQKRASAIVLGDYHTGFEDPSVIQNWKECVKETNPKYIVFHDLFDGHSINPFHKRNMERQVNRQENVSTLEKELNLIGSTLKLWNSEFPDQELLVVYSNHDDFLKRYLVGGEYINDRTNHRLSLKLALWILDEKNPIEEYIKETFPSVKAKWLKEGIDYKIHNVHIGYHGHKSTNSLKSKGVTSLEKAFNNSIVAHAHTPGIFRNTIIVGTSTFLKLDYNLGGSSTWLPASAILYPNGKKQLVVSIKNKWKL